MAYRTRLIAGGVLFFGLLAGVAITMPTFGRRCAEAFDPKSPAYERCVLRLSTGEGGVHYITKTERIPVVD